MKDRYSPSNNSKSHLLEWWSESVRSLAPEKTFSPLFSQIRRNSDSTALLFLGKAAAQTERASRAAGLSSCSRFVVSPESAPKEVLEFLQHPLKKNRRQLLWSQGEHPLPGEGSFFSGSRYVNWLEQLADEGVQNLEIFLSGGASSLFWLLPADWSRVRLERELQDLYRRPLTIEQLNQRRSRLCCLKNGGAARIARARIPSIKMRVHLISDVEPFGPEVVASGPFWLGPQEFSLPHLIYASNTLWVSDLKSRAEKSGVKVLSAESAQSGGWNTWVKRLDDQVRRSQAIRSNRSSLILLGGEPQVDLRGVKKPGRGGRQSQIATALALKYWDRILNGEIEILAASSDGLDGSSGSSGTYFSKDQIQRANRWNLQDELVQALQDFNTAGVLKKIGALLPAAPTGTNVQDVVMVSVKNPKSARD